LSRVIGYSQRLTASPAKKGFVNTRETTTQYKRQRLDQYLFLNIRASSKSVMIHVNGAIRNDSIFEKIKNIRF
jgi:hypothetical protein